MAGPYRLLVFALLSLALVAKAGGQGAAEIPYVSDSHVTVDGVVNPGEYGGAFQDPATGMSIHWEHNGTVLRVGMGMQCQGWLSVGFGPVGTKMDGSNMIIGYVNAAGLSSVLDEVGVARQHYPDTERGGTNDVLAYAGVQASGNTTIEFEFPLVSGDHLDTPMLSNHTYGFFLGYQSTARDTTTYHTDHSPTYAVLIEPVPSVPLPPQMQSPFQLEETIAAVAVIITTLAVIRYIRRPKVIRFRPPPAQRSC